MGGGKEGRRREVSNTVCVKSSEQINKEEADPLQNPSKKNIHSSTLCSFCLFGVFDMDQTAAQECPTGAFTL